MSERPEISRRSFLLTASGAAGGAAATGLAAGQEGDGNETDGGDGGGGEGGGGGGGGGEPAWPSYVDDANDEGYEDLRGEGSVTVDADSNFFAPTFIWVDPGTEITWEFVAPGHNVKPNDQPDGGGLDGTEGDELTPVSEGETYSVTLETSGMYTYFCGPHEGIGMKGAVAVGEVETSGGGGEGGGSNVPSVPDSAKSLGIAAAFAMASTLGLSYFFIKYGGDYAGEPEA